MAKVTWLGEGDAGPEETQAFGKTFKLGEPVEITDEEALKSATGNQFFDVTPSWLQERVFGLKVVEEGFKSFEEGP
jgi:hypothetical protein